MSEGWVAQGRLQAAGYRLEYACWGPPPNEAPTLVMLHEGLGCTALWREVPAQLSDRLGWGVMAYSRAGYGQSDPVPLPRPLDYMTREATGALPQVVAALGLREFVVLGHSDGATIAAIYAGMCPDPALRGVVAIAPHLFAEPEGLAEIARAKQAYDTGDLRARLAKYHRDPDVAFHGWNTAWLDPRFAEWSVADVADGLRVPALIIQGREDPYGTLAQVTAFEARSPCRVETLILDGCGHAPQLEHPDTVLPAIADFCQGLVRD